MFQLQTACPAQHTNTPSRHRLFSVEPGLIGRRLLPVLAAAALVGAMAAAPRSAPVAAPYSSPVIVQDSDVLVLRDKAEAMRAQLLATPGVGAVSIDGLRQQRLVVDYTPRHLARFGLTQADLAASLPVDAATSLPGHLALAVSTGPDGLEDAANLPVRSKARVFRLGDVAAVSRAPLDTPVSTMTIEGRPAAVLRVVGSR